jgi:methionyl-tRNA formyltransferase
MLRIVSLHASLAGYRLVAEWAARHGHELALVVTPSAEDAIRRYGGDQTPLALQLPELGQPCLPTDRLIEAAAPAVAALQPDLVISATYPRLIPAEITGMPTYGAVNLHPSALPRGRGPNPQRLIYAGDPTAGATLHRTAASFDTGVILSRREVPLPDPLTARVLRDLWARLLGDVLEEGVGRVLAGDPGVPQDETLATTAAHFTQDERWLDLTEPAVTLQRRTAALNLAAPSALARVGDQDLMILGIETVDGPRYDVKPGALIHWEADEVVLVQSGTGPIRLRIC